MAAVMVQVNGLCKRYGDVDAVAGISFSIQRGEVVGFLGPNGAGKSTTMKILTGYLAPNAGSVTVDGLDAYEQSLEVRERIGYLPENNPLYPELLVVDFLQYAADVRGLSKARAAERIREVGTRCGLREVAGKAIGELSKGYRQRVGLAQALLHDPPVLILDEPTSGLDPNQIVEIRQLIHELGEDHTVILSTHNLPEVMQVCNRLLIIHEGKIVADGTADAICQQEAENAAVILEVEGEGISATDITDTIKEKLPVREVMHLRQNGSYRFTLRPDGETDLRPDLFDLAAESGWRVLELRRDAGDLEGIFRRLTQD